jgi:hypothetical protein
MVEKEEEDNRNVNHLLVSFSFPSCAISEGFASASLAVFHTSITSSIINHIIMNVTMMVDMGWVSCWIDLYSLAIHYRLRNKISTEAPSCRHQPGEERKPQRKPAAQRVQEEEAQGPSNMHGTQPKSQRKEKGPTHSQ